MSHVTNQDIAAYLRSAIRDGVYAPGDAIPSESALCRQFGTARGTVRQAVATLRSEGLVTSGQGRRSRVLERLPAQSFDEVISFTEWCTNSGITPGQQTQSIAKVRASEHLASELSITPGDMVVSVHRLRLMDGEPAMVERLNYNLETGQHLMNFDTDSGSIYSRLLAVGVDIDHVTRTIDAIGATDEDALLLGVDSGTPMLRVRRRAFTADGTPIESSDDRYLFDKASFAVTTSRGNPQAISMMQVYE
ncbi:GntR family transcriptional regulator [Corynebacterium cystitidis]|uniref:GntR family transcriptional regulator n=1 Tax=Corynebacterium cystitidis TaxID=35757 RepID=UPI00211F0A64|nr:GntR family transcriptional regulator [Corynebacterium cystitidis]